MFNMSPQVVRSRLATLFIENLRDILDQKGVNQKQLSEISGVSENGISKIFLGTRQIRFDTLEDICNALEISPGILFEEKQAN
jgi:DNA-binding Xre family transcriptional regulator